MRTCWDRDPVGRDVEFFDALVEFLSNSYCIDPKRVFSVGHSRGGRFVEVLACNRDESHRAVASIAAGVNNVTRCGGNPPIWLSHSVQDEIIDFGDGESHRRAWAERNGCDPPKRDAPLDTCTKLSGCPVDNPVVWCPTSEEDWKGHAVPGLADEEIWKFFSDML
jgi:polyhydroxybutyrate depolymerase